MQEDDKLYNCFYNSEEVIKKVIYYIEKDFCIEPEFKEINKNIFWDIENNCEKIYEQITK